MLDRQERKKKCCPRTTSFITNYYLQLCCLYLPPLHLSLLLCLSPLFFFSPLVWISLEIIFFFCHSSLPLAQDAARSFWYFSFHSTVFFSGCLPSAVLSLTSLPVSLHHCQQTDQDLLWFWVGTSNTRNQTKEAFWVVGNPELLFVSVLGGIKVFISVL